MRRSIFAVLAATVLASSTGCCCLERLFCWGCCGGSCPYGGGYGHEGPCNSCGYSGGGYCSDCAAVGKRSYGPEGAVADGEYYDESAAAPPRAIVNNHPADGHPLVRKRRNAGGEYEFAAGPPSGGVTYPYYTNRGPRDFLARNPRGSVPDRAQRPAVASALGECVHAAHVRSSNVRAIRDIS